MHIIVPDEEAKKDGMSSSVKSIMVEMAVDLFLRDLREDSGRAARNLIDVGMRFAKGRFRENFLPCAQAMMADPFCPYYRLLENVAKNVDRRLLRIFGINLGYRAWTCGTAALRESERRTGHYLPWCLFFDLKGGGPLAGDSEGIVRIVSEAKELGISSFVFFADLCTLPVDEIASKNRDCAFFLFTEPSSVDSGFAERLSAAGNVACSLHAPFSDPDSARAAAALLARRSCLFGFHAWYSDGVALPGEGGPWLAACEGNAGTFAFFIRSGSEAPESAAAARAYVDRLRMSPEQGIFAVDLYEDFAAVDRMTGGSPRFAVLRGDGSITSSLAEGPAGLTPPLALGVSPEAKPGPGRGSFSERLLRVMPLFAFD